MLFWSPELVQQKIVNHKVDVWALGIVILEVLNGGKAPYEDEKLDEDEVKIISLTPFLFIYLICKLIFFYCRLNRESWMLVNQIIHLIYLLALWTYWIVALTLIHV